MCMPGQSLSCHGLNHFFTLISYWSSPPTWSDSVLSSFPIGHHCCHGLIQFYAHSYWSSPPSWSDSILCSFPIGHHLYHGLINFHSHFLLSIISLVDHHFLKVVNIILPCRLMSLFQVEQFTNKIDSKHLGLNY